jgi:transcription initiation factor IIE alpha subunit
MKTFEVQFRYRDRNEGTVESTIKLEASSLPGAIGKAAREFVKGLDRKQRFDMNKNGLEITAKSVGTTTEAQAGKPAEAAAS